MGNAVATYDLSRAFGPIRAVDHLNMTVEEGAMFGLVGPDGSGKTTTIRMLCGILAPTGGTASVLGHDIARESDALKKEIGYLSQRFTLYGDLTVDENIEFFAEINRVYDYRPRREELLEFTRLTPFRTRLADKLSGGMKQKLALACTLVHSPRLIFLDEPTTGVDPVSRRDFWKILQSLLKQGITIVMTTPYLDEAERCARVGLMNHGSLMRLDSPENLKSAMVGEILEVVCDRVRDASALLKAGGGSMQVQAFGDRLHLIDRDAASQETSIRRRLERGGIRVTGIRRIEPSLENVFIALLTQGAGPGEAR